MRYTRVPDRAACPSRYPGDRAGKGFPGRGVAGGWKSVPPNRKHPEWYYILQYQYFNSHLVARLKSGLCLRNKVKRRYLPGTTAVFSWRNARSYRKCAGEDGSGADGCWGRRTFDKTVSRKALAFAGDAGPMGIEWRFGTRVRVGACSLGGIGRPFGKLIAGGEVGYGGLPVAMRSSEERTPTRLA